MEVKQWLIIYKIYKIYLNKKKNPLNREKIISFKEWGNIHCQHIYRISHNQNVAVNVVFVQFLYTDIYRYVLCNEN